MLLLHFTAHSWLLASLAGSCVILFGMPDNEMAQPRSFLGGHVIAATVGLVFLRFGTMRFGGPSELRAMAAVATVPAAHDADADNPFPCRGRTRSSCSPSTRGGASSSRPLFLGPAALLVTALLINNRSTPRRYPRTWR